MRITRRLLPPPAALLFALSFVTGFVTPRSAQALVITELMASNATTIADNDGDYSDWVEIFNNSASVANLGGMYLTDDEFYSGGNTHGQPRTHAVPGGAERRAADLGP